MDKSEIYRLELAARPESVALARLFLATVLRVSAASEEVVEDAKLAVSELATSAVLTSGGERLQITAATTAAGIEVTVEPFAGGEDPSSVERMDVAAALFPTTEHDVARRRVGFVVDLAAQ